MLESFPTDQGLQAERLNATIVIFSRKSSYKAVDYREFFTMIGRLNMLERALGRGMVQLHVGALSYHANFLGHQPEPLKTNATLRAAL